jgi:hypothetical protein
MSTASAPVRELAPSVVEELCTAAEQILEEGRTSATSPTLLEHVAESAGNFRDVLRHDWRPVGTPDGLFLLRGLEAGRLSRAVCWRRAVPV